MDWHIDLIVSQTFIVCHAHQCTCLQFNVHVLWVTCFRIECLKMYSWYKWQLEKCIWMLWALTQLQCEWRGFIFCVIIMCDMAAVMPFTFGINYILFLVYSIPGYNHLFFPFCLISSLKDTCPIVLSNHQTSEDRSSVLIKMLKFLCCLQFMLCMWFVNPFPRFCLSDLIQTALHTFIDGNSFCREVLSGKTTSTETEFSSVLVSISYWKTQHQSSSI